MVDREANHKYKAMIREHLNVSRKNVANLVFNRRNFQPLEIEDNASIARLVRFTEGLEIHTALFVIAVSKVSTIIVHL